MRQYLLLLLTLLNMYFRALPRRSRLLQSEVSRPVLQARVSSSIKLYGQYVLYCTMTRVVYIYG